MEQNVTALDPAASPGNKFIHTIVNMATEILILRVLRYF